MTTATGIEIAAELAPTGYTAHALRDLPQLWDGFATLVREGLGIAGFGVQIMDLPPDHVTTTHDERATGQQELYVALGGAGAVVVHGERDQRLQLDPEHVVAVGPAVARTLVSGPDGMRVLCVGGAPGRAYEPPEWTTGA